MSGKNVKKLDYFLNLSGRILIATSTNTVKIGYKGVIWIRLTLKARSYTREKRLLASFMSVLPSVRTCQLGSYLTDFCEN